MTIGEYRISKDAFPGVDAVLKRLRSKKEISEQKRGDAVSRALLELIEEAPAEEFLLTSILDFIERVSAAKIVDHYLFSTFELWLNQASGLSFEDNLRIRGKIVGKWVPRDEYQAFFPIGMGKIYPGTHFVTAHSSPDLDTTVASFWGWVDAFAARVSEGVHVWNLPGGAPISQVEVTLLFEQVFGSALFTYLAKGRVSLAISASDLLTKSNMVCKEVHESTLGEGNEAVVLVDHEGHYLGEWREADFESVRFIITLLNQCLRWYENHLHVELISLFAKEPLRQKELASFVQKMLDIKLEECEPAREFNKKQKKELDDYLVKVLGVKKGAKSSIAAFAQGMQKLGLAEFREFETAFLKLPTLKLEARSQIFTALAKIIHGLDQAIFRIRLYVERLDVALSVKKDVLGILPHPISIRADLEEIRGKMGDLSYVTVTVADRRGKLCPLGVIHATDLYRPALGTVSLRDFCNREETKIPPYLEIISVIDHHKSNLITTKPPVAFITDAQSSNALVAQLSFSINDQYSSGGMTLSEIETQIQSLQKKLNAPSSNRILQRLLQRYLAVQRKTPFFVSPKREIIEYLHFLYAILDDTDLLTKISMHDIEAVASLLNRLKSLTVKKEVEIVHFDDIPKDNHFVKLAAKRLLQNEEMYSLYRKIYLSKEKAVEENLKLGLQGKASTTFVDTKEQNGCCRVGQTKLFAKNFPTFQKHLFELRRLWLENAQEIYEKKKEVDFHLHMISTLTGADELYKGDGGNFRHQDEIWIWIPSTETAVSHLKMFLSAFQLSPQVMGNKMSVEFLGDNAPELEEIFIESFIDTPRKKSAKKLPLAVLYFTAGSINSRKAMISPYLPSL